MTINDVFAGKIVAWPNSDEMGRDAGYGEVVKALESPFLLVRQQPSPGNPEPPHMLVVGFDEPGLAFFDTQDEHDTWLASILNEPSPVIPRARKTNRPKR